MDPNNMFPNYSPLECKKCGKDVLLNAKKSIMVFEQDDSGIVKQVYACCKGACDSALGRPSGWKDISDFTNPLLYLQHIMAILNNIQDDELRFEEEALKNYKDILLKTAPFVFRELEQSELEKAAFNASFPF